MNFLIDCEDEKQQIEVLQKLEKEGYSWRYSGKPTNFVPISEYPWGKTIITQPNMTLSYAGESARTKERAHERYKDSHKFVTGREYLRRVIL